MRKYIGEHLTENDCIKRSVDNSFTNSWRYAFEK